MGKIEINMSGDLKFENGDFIIENGDFAINDFIHTNIDLYYHLATVAFEKMKSEYEKHIPKVLKLSVQLRNSWKLELEEYLQRYAIQSIIFSALSIEALINYYGANRLEDSVFKEKERIPTMEKYKLFPILSLKKMDSFTFNEADTQILYLIRDLMKCRDKLVHFKTKTTKFNSKKANHHITLKLAENSINTVKIACDFLCKMDEDFIFSFEKNINDFNTDSFNIPEQGWWGDGLMKNKRC